MNIVVERDIPVSMRDGIKLTTDVWRLDSDEARPTIVMRHPYSKDDPLLLNLAANVQVLVKNGFSVVVQDCRGRFGAEGIFTPFINEASDTEDTLSWVSLQPWSNGNIGLMGESYSGFVQWQGAATGNPLIKAIAPTQSWTDSYSGFVYSKDGAFQLGGILNWATLYMGFTEWERSHSENMDLFGDLLEAADRPNESFKKELASRKDLKEVAPYVFDWSDRPNRDSWWDDPKRSTPISNIKVPALIVGGWHDVFADATLDSFIQMRAKAATDEARSMTRLVMGPWAHSMYSAEYPQKMYGLLASAAGFELTNLFSKWFDALLNENHSALDDVPRVTVFVAGIDEWRTFEDWPVPQTEQLTYLLSSGGKANSSSGDGKLSLFASSQGDVDTLIFDPANPVPTVGGKNMLPGLSVCTNTGPWDQSTLEARNDVLCYTSETLTEDLAIFGPVVANITVSIESSSMDFTAKLVDIYPDGRAEIVTDGIRRFTSESSTSLEPNKCDRLGINLGSTARVFQKGHKLRLEIANSNFPKFDINPELISKSSDSSTFVNKIHHNPEMLNSLTLHVYRDFS
jgi:putative CocE/NonD family hydrolase